MLGCLCSCETKIVYDNERGCHLVYKNLVYFQITADVMAT